jgi:adenylyltransferase/sulfurtransferase
VPIGRPAAELPELNEEELLRYGRHLMLPELGQTGQRRLKDARVLLVGAGGLGSAVGLYLAAAGVGTLGVVEFDTVDRSNLQRQILHGTKDVGRRKVDSARDRIRDVNPNVNVVGHDARLADDNVMELVRAYDLVVDATDNLAARYLTSDACVRLGKPNVYGSVFRFEGQASVFGVAGGPCLRCLHPEPPQADLLPAASGVGVLGVLPGLVGTIQATEAIKLIAGIGRPLVGRLLLVDALEPSFRAVTLRRSPECPSCAGHPATAPVA